MRREPVDDPITVRVLSDKWRKATKQHTCTVCHKPIKKGTMYHVIAMLVEGDFTVEKMHTTNGMCALV